MNAKNNVSVKGCSAEEKEVLEREWEGIEVVDATEKLRLFVSVEDISSARRKDAACCALANCCKRALGSSKVFFYRSVAYVHNPAANRVERYTLSEAAKEFVSEFDKGKSVSAQEVVLNPPRPSERLNSKAKAQRSQRSQKKAKLAGKNPLKGVRKKSVKPVLISDGVRSGTGQVKFTTGKATGKAVN